MLVQGRPLGPVIAAAAAVALLLSGCAAEAGDPPTVVASPAVSAPADNGITALPAPAILKKAQQALAAAKSYHLSGLVCQDGVCSWIDLKVAGKTMLGSLTTDDMTLKILVVDGLRLVQLDEATLTATFGAGEGRKLTKELAGSWLKPDAKSFRELAARFDVAELIEPAGKLTKGATRIINQRPVVALRDAGGDYEELYVATTGAPLPQKMSIEDEGRALFTDYGRDFPDIKAPAAKDIIDLSGSRRR